MIVSLRDEYLMNKHCQPARTAMLILPCPTCRRAVKVFGKVRRVLCACGEVLLEIGRKDPYQEKAS